MREKRRQSSFYPRGRIHHLFGAVQKVMYCRIKLPVDAPLTPDLTLAYALSVPVSNNAILTVAEVAHELRCSKAHVHNLINGRVPGTKALPSLNLGRRRLVRRESLNSWIEINEQGKA